jgi:hypothetical protein
MPMAVNTTRRCRNTSNWVRFTMSSIIPNSIVRDKHEPFEVYKLIDGEYVLLSGEPVWLPELNLGIGRGNGMFENWEREWLYWYDQDGQRYPSPPELLQEEREQIELLKQQAEQAQQRAEQERERANLERDRAEQERANADRLRQKLREMGIDPDDL